MRPETPGNVGKDLIPNVSIMGNCRLGKTVWKKGRFAVFVTRDKYVVHDSLMLVCYALSCDNM